ncbi:MAG: hypothetical protein FJ388_01680 [Verrucomicrobia bacterium]|nr:hypothetical protein [Verrucomicrobiota bacterium]
MLDLGYMPDTIVAGETIWIAAANTTQPTDSDIIFTDYLPADYNLAYQFASATPSTVSAVANGAGTGWTLEVTAATTLTWKAGRIRFAGYVTAKVGGRVYAVDAGAIEVTASPLATSAWTAVVAACDAAILAQMGTGQASGAFSVDGMSKSFSYRSAEELITLRAYAQNMADAETGNRQKRIIRTRFT